MPKSYVDVKILLAFAAVGAVWTVELRLHSALQPQVTCQVALVLVTLIATDAVVAAISYARFCNRFLYVANIYLLFNCKLIHLFKPYRVLHTRP